MDDDDKKPEDEAAEPAPDAAQEEGAKFRKVSEEELKRILEAHETWVETDGKEGMQANLRRTDLQKAGLRNANLRGADLQGAKLQEADLRRAKLQGANLLGADLQGANLTGADLTKAKGLTREQLDEACGDDETNLPDDLADYQMKLCPKPEESPSN